MADILNIEDGVLEKCTDKSVTSVVIPSSVTEIGYDAFRGCKSLSSVEIPESVTEIGGGAFDGCESLSSVSIPPSVTKIGWGAFRGCTSLSSVVIPSSVTKISKEAFKGCTSLSSVEIPESVTEIGGDAFKGCNINELSHPCLTIKGGLVVEESKLLYCASQSSSITIPEGVTEISGSTSGGGAFKGCKSLASVVIPPSVTNIGWEAFDGCKSLTSVVIPESVTEIGGCAFAGCESLSSVEIPSSVAEIGVWAFRDCSSLMSVTIPESVTKIDNGAFEDCKSLAKVTLGDDFKKVPSEWFDDLNRANPNYEIVCTEGSSTYKAIKRSSKLKLHHKSLNLKSLNVTKEDLELQKAKNAKIAEVRKAGVDAILPMVLEGVADSSFEILSNTKSATVALVQVGKNTGVFKLGADSSKWLPKLQKVIEAMADSTKSGADIFGVIKEQKMPLGEIPAKKAGNTTLKADSSGGLNLFALGALRKMEYDGMKDIGLFGVTEIGEKVFEGCFSLSSVVIGESVTEIGWKAFGGCESLSSVVIPEGVTKIGEETFKGCKSLTSVVIPEGVKKIGNSAFEGCSSLTSVVIPSSVTKIGWHVFENCKSLASVVIPSSVTEIGWGAFENCESLSSVAFGGTVAQWEAVEGKPELLRYIPASSVNCADGEWQKLVVLVENGVAVDCLDKSAASVVIPEGVTEIGGCSFEGCTSLASVVIPPSVTAIYGKAFSGCKALTAVEFGGTMAQWEAVKKGGGWHEYVPATGVKCSDGEAKL